MNHWLDNYINGENLAPDDLRYMHYYPLHLFAYKMKDYDNYESIKGGLALLQMSFYRGYHFKDVSYILDQTGLTKWQKLWLKIRYVMF